MQFPECGKVLVIDDQISEALPLLNVLSKKGVSALYYNGTSNSFPECPLNSVRLIFCDLKFNVAADSKSVVSNIVGILSGLIDKKNGPYILLIWSTHEIDYLDNLKTALHSAEIKPEFILQLTKAEFFYTQDKAALFIDPIRSGIEKMNLDTQDEKKIIGFIESYASTTLSLQQVPKEDALENIEKKLAEELRKANLFHLFVLWENTIGSSAIQTVNNIYDEIPDEIPTDKKLRAMLYYLAYHRLEKQMDSADLELKFWASMDSLNEMFAYFYTENVHKLSCASFDIEKIDDIQELKEISPAKFNKWRMITVSKPGKHPGNVYRDNEKRFQYHGLINHDFNSNKQNYIAVFEQLKSEEKIEYILIDLSSDCDIAQNKIFVSRIVPGVMIPEDLYTNYANDKKIKSSNVPEYIFLIKRVEVNDTVWNIAFNVNQLSAIEMDKLNDEQLLFSLTNESITSIKQRAATCISKQGIENF